MKKIIIIFVLIVVGFVVFQYLERTTDKQTALEKYQKDMEMPYMKLDAFFNSADLILAGKDTSNIKKEIKKDLLSTIKAAENDMAMISSKDEEIQKLHKEFLDHIKTVHKGLAKAAKGKENKAKRAVSKQAKAMTNYYNAHKEVLADLNQKYNVEIGSMPEPTQEPTKYDEYDDYLDNAQGK